MNQTDQEESNTDRAGSNMFRVGSHTALLDQTGFGLDQTWSELDQTWAFLDQSLSRLDQTWFRFDQTRVLLDQTLSKFDRIMGEWMCVRLSVSEHTFLTLVTFANYDFGCSHGFSRIFSSLENRPQKKLTTSVAPMHFPAGAFFFRES